MPTERAVRMTLLLPAIAGAACLFAGCAADGTGKAVAEAAGMATTPQESKDFVRATRSVEPQYIPVGSSITRAAPRKQIDQFKAIEADLEAKRLANEAAGNAAQKLGATSSDPQPAKIPTN